MYYQRSLLGVLDEASPFLMLWVDRLIGTQKNERRERLCNLNTGLLICWPVVGPMNMGKVGPQRSVQRFPGPGS